MAGALKGAGKREPRAGPPGFPVLGPGLRARGRRSSTAYRALRAGGGAGGLAVGRECPGPRPARASPAAIPPLSQGVEGLPASAGDWGAGTPLRPTPPHPRSLSSRAYSEEPGGEASARWRRACRAPRVVASGVPACRCGSRARATSGGGAPRVRLGAGVGLPGGSLGACRDLESSSPRCSWGSLVPARWQQRGRGAEAHPTPSFPYEVGAVHAPERPQVGEV